MFKLEIRLEKSGLFFFPGKCKEEFRAPASLEIGATQDVRHLDSFLLFSLEKTFKNITPGFFIVV